MELEIPRSLLQVFFTTCQETNRALDQSVQENALKKTHIVLTILLFELRGSTDPVLAAINLTEGPSLCISK